MEDFSVLDKRNGGEESMQSFIQHHILTVLQPVTEEVRELRQELQHVAKDMALSDAKLEDQGATLNRVDRDLLDLQVSNKQFGTWMKGTQAELAKGAEQRAKADREHDATKLALAKANERHQHCMASVESLERQLGQLGSGFNSLKAVVAGTEQNLQEHGRGLAELKDSHDDLTACHTSTASKLERSAELGEATERDLRKLLKSHEREREEVGVVLRNLSTHANQLQELLDATSDLSQRQSSELRAASAGLVAMRAALEFKDGSSRRLDIMQNRDEETAGALRKHLESFEKLHRMVEGLNGHLGSGDKVQSGGVYSELVEEIRLKLEALESDVSKMGRTQTKHVEQLKGSLTAIEKLQRDQRRMQDNADATDQELVGLLGAQKQAASKMDNHALEQQRLQSNLQNIGQEVDSGLQQVRGDLGTASKTIAKLRSHSDACNQNLFGLAKGFQDAGRQTHGGEGTPSPKVARGPLPALDARSSPTPRGGYAGALDRTNPGINFAAARA